MLDCTRADRRRDLPLLLAQMGSYRRLAQSPTAVQLRCRSGKFLGGDDVEDFGEFFALRVPLTELREYQRLVLGLFLDNRCILPSFIVVVFRRLVAVNEEHLLSLV